MRTKLLRSSAAGFTLIELIVVMVIIGVLFSIAGPGWLAFANRQRVNSVRDELLQEIRRTQALAAQTRRAQTFTLSTATDPPSVQITPGEAQLRQLGKGQIAATVIQVQSTDADNRISFDGRGNLVEVNQQGNAIPSEELPDGGLKFTVSLRANPSVKSCAIVQTLLGATQTANGDRCN